MQNFYAMYPTVFRDQTVFCSEDDLWTVPLQGGLARRLTSGRGVFSRPHFSPDGKWLAMSAEEEGSREIFMMPSQGGEIKRLTYLGSISNACGWNPSSKTPKILFSSHALTPHRTPWICEVSPKGEEPTQLKLGPAVGICVNLKGQVLLERSQNRSDIAWWKNYRGGTAGRIWIGQSLKSEFQLLFKDGIPYGDEPTDKLAPQSRPIWFGGKIYFISDAGGRGSIFCVDSNGKNLKKINFDSKFYPRNLSTDGRTIVFHAGGDIYALHPKTGRTSKIKIEFASQRPQRQRKLISPEDGFEHIGLSPDAKKIVVTSRGRITCGGALEGPVRDLSPDPACRYRLAQFVDAQNVVMVRDQASRNGDEWLESVDLKSGERKTLKFANALGLGRVASLTVSPDGKWLAMTNHRCEFWTIEIKSGKATLIDRDHFFFARKMTFSPDSKWVAYSCSVGISTNVIKVAPVDGNGKARAVTSEFNREYSPSFDRNGKFLYLITQRNLDPVPTPTHFDHSFQLAPIAALVVLDSKTPSPTLVTMDTPKPKNNSKNKDKGKKKESPKVNIDFDGIENRLIKIPVDPKPYARIVGLDGGKVALLSFPIEGSLASYTLHPTTPHNGTLEIYDFSKKSVSTFMEGISDFALSEDGKSFLIQIGDRVRVVEVSDKAPKGKGREAGDVDLSRFSAMIDPALEWKQMFYEIWRLQRDHFWNKEQVQREWDSVLKQYEPMLDRISSRSEFSDLIWEFQGELKISHAYDMGGDYRRVPSIAPGKLGADLISTPDGLKVDRVLIGDNWDDTACSPLSGPGAGLKSGDLITEINGQRVGSKPSGVALLNLAQAEVEIKVARQGKSKSPKSIDTLIVKTLKGDTALRYQDWIARNEAFVREKSGGRLGYIHIPDMGANGFSKFYRAFLRQYDCDGLVVDLRYNGGGNVSQLLLEKLSRKRVGYDHSRWFKPGPIPSESPTGVIVGLTNEHAGSDGDIGSHTFKLRGLGPLIGMRTWGGVVGIWPQHGLVDGSITTQPEFATYMHDVHYGLENYGTDPDIELDNAPHDYLNGKDPQLDFAISEGVRLLEESPPLRTGWNK